VVTVLDGYKHKFEDSDVIHFKEVQGMRTEDGKSINDCTNVKIKVINTTKFEISEDASNYSAYEGSGIAKQVKVPAIMSFKSMEKIDNEEANQQAYFD
jgi:hypothetical protein